VDHGAHRRPELRAAIPDPPARASAAGARPERRPSARPHPRARCGGRVRLDRRWRARPAPRAPRAGASGSRRPGRRIRSSSCPVPRGGWPGLHGPTHLLHPAAPPRLSPVHPGPGLRPPGRWSAPIPTPRAPTGRLGCAPRHA